MATNQRKKELRLGSNDVVTVVRRFAYDFGVEGGAIGTITLAGKDNNADNIPAGSVITRCRTVCRTAATSGGAATVELGVSQDTDAFEGATAYTDNSYDTVGTVDVKEAALPLLVGATDVSVSAIIAGAALTAGAFDVLVEFIPPNAGERYVARS